jgi:hypothetical protein
LRIYLPTMVRTAALNPHFEKVCVRPARLSAE